MGISMKTMWFVAAAAVAVSLAAVGAQAASLVNGSFEDTTNFTNNTNQDNDSLPGGSTAMTGWTVLPGHNVSWIGPTNPFQLTASNGSYFLDLTDYNDGAPYGGVQQSVNLAPGKYVLTFDLGSSNLYGTPDGLTASAGLTSQTFTSTLTGKSNWEPESLAFTVAGAGPTVLTFAGASGDAYIGLDNVALTGGVPEPAAWTMMLLGVGLIGGGLRLARRKDGTAPLAV